MNIKDDVSTIYNSVTRIIILCLLVTKFGYSQNSFVPPVNLPNLNQDNKNYFEMLGVTDKNALILKVSIGGGWVRMSDSYFVFLSNGDIETFITFSKFGEIIKKKYSIHEENEKERLRKLALQLNEIDPSRTNLKYVELGRGEWDVEDGGEISIEAFRGDKSVRFYSEAPGDFIKFKVMGYDMRQKLLDVFTEFDATRYIRTPSLEEVKSWDAVYVNFEKGPLQEHWESHHIPKYLYNLQHITIFLDEIKTDGTPKPKRITKRVKNQTIDFDFFMKYGPKAIDVLMDKQIYLINTAQVKKQKVVMKQVRASYLLL